MSFRAAAGENIHGRQVIGFREFMRRWCFRRVLTRRAERDIAARAVEMDGAIKLDDGLALLSGSRKALLAAACSVKRPQTFHARMSLREAEAFVGKCRLGQTERGSFVATIECALDIGDASPTDGAIDNAEPFGRKATTLMMSSIDMSAATMKSSI